jgi:hypothetical protein
MRTFTQREIITLEEYLQTIIGNPTPFYKQKSVFDDNGRCLWCEEWELIEMLKFLFNGKDIYYRDPPPNRLKNSTAWSKEAVEAKVEQELGSMETVEQIINYLRKVRENFHESI